MKRSLSIAFMTILVFLLVLSCGCGAAKTEDTGSKTDSQKDGQEADDVTQTDYDLGLVEGYEDGFSQGYTDGKAGEYDPDPVLGPDVDEDYAAGYEEGYLKGYEKGYNEARIETEDGGEAKAVEEAMLAFVKKNSAEGLEFKIEDIVINGDEAAGTVICTSEKLESALVIMKKGPGGWYGVDFGTGIDAPSWYQP